MGDPPIWKRLDDEREARGMQRAEWARYLGVSPAVYNHWKDREVPTTKYADLMAKTRWSFDRLVKGVVDGASAADEERSRFLAYADSVYTRLSPAGRKHCSTLLETVENCEVLQQAHEKLPAYPRGRIDVEGSNDDRERTEPEKPSSSRGARRAA